MCKITLMDETWHETTSFRIDKNKNERQVKGQLGLVLQFYVRRKRNCKGFPQRVWEHVENCNIPQPLPGPRENLRPGAHTIVYCVKCNLLGGWKPLNFSEIKPKEYYLVLIDILLYCQTNKIIFQYVCFTIKIILVCSIHMDLNNIT